jgi:hypothetical protein
MDDHEWAEKVHYLQPSPANSPAPEALRMSVAARVRAVVASALAQPAPLLRGRRGSVLLFRARARE